MRPATDRKRKNWKLPPRKRDWSEGHWQIGLFLRTADGRVLQCIWNDAPESLARLVGEIASGKLKGVTPKEEKVMEKYGVDETGADLEKKAAEGCPECGKKPTRHGQLLMCPTHGSAPFEKEKGK